MKFIFFIISLFLLYLYNKLKAPKGRFDALPFILFPWIGVFFLLSLPIIKGQHFEVDFITLYIIISGLLVFVFSYKKFSSQAKSKINFSYSSTTKKKINRFFKIIALLAIIAAIGDYSLKIGLYKIDFNKLLYNASEGRQQIITTMITQKFERSFFQKISVLLISNWMIAFIVGILKFETLNRSSKFLLILVFFIPIWLSISVFGRGPFITEAILFLVLIFIRKNIGLQTLPPLEFLKINIFSAIFFVGIIASLLFFISRSWVKEDVGISFLEYGLSIKYTDFARKLLEPLPIGINKIIFFTLYYFTSPIYNFVPMLQNGLTNIPGPYFIWELPSSLANNLIVKIFGGKMWEDIFVELGLYYAGLNQNLAIYRTAFSSFILDFSIFGFYPFLWFWGFILGKSTFLLNLRHTLIDGIFTAIFTSIPVFFIFFSPISGFSYAIVFAIIYYFFSRENVMIRINDI